MKNKKPHSENEVLSKKPISALLILALISIIENIYTLMSILSIRSEGPSQILLGLSIERLAVVMGLAVFLFLMVFLSVSVVFPSRFTQNFLSFAAQHRYGLLITSCGLLLFFGWLSLVPGHNFEEAQAYYIRLKPVFTFIALISLNVILYQIYYAYLVEKVSLRPIVGKYKSIFSFSVIILLAIGLVWGIVWKTRLGITPHQYYWGEAGSPVFGYQVVISLALSGLIFWLTTAFFRKLNGNNKQSFLRKDMILFFILWIAASSIWVSAPISRNFFLPAPVAPNMDYYPFSDAAEYDIFSQSILIGEGFWNKTFTYRPAYVFFLFLLHIAVGQDYLAMINLQTVFLALSVPILYLLGKQIHSRIVGLLIAFLGIWMELNSIRSTPFIQVTHSKLLLTEFPTGVLLLAATLFFVKWINDRADKHLYITFGILGLSLLVRLHTITVVLLFLGVVIFQNRKYLRKWLLIGGGLSIFVFLIITPWMMRNYLVVGSFSPDPNRLEYLIESRWELEGKTRDSSTLGRLQKPILPSNATDTMIGNTQGINNPNANCGVSPKENSSIGANIQNPPCDLIPQKIRMSSGFFEIKSEIGETFLEVVEHYLHNEILAVVSMPLTYRFESISAYYRESFQFTQSWAGSFAPGQIIMLVLNLTVIAVGVGGAIQRKGIAGLIPLFVHLSYNASNALARTSGWRYLKPTDWVIPLYFCIGVFEIAVLLWIVISGKQSTASSPSHSPPSTITPPTRRTAIVWGMFFITIGFLISFVPYFIPRKFTPPYSSPELTTTVRDKMLEELNLPADQIDKILTNPNTIATSGTAIYPRYFLVGEGINHYSWNQFDSVELPKLVFTLINNQRTNVLLPLSHAPDKFPQGSKVIVLGCQGEDTLLALAVILVGEDEEFFYIRQPINNYQCSFPELPYE